MERNPWLRALIVLATLALALYLGGMVWGLIQHYADIIVVFFLAWLLAFILSPLAGLIERSYRTSRAVASAFVYLLLFFVVGVVFVLIIPLAVNQLTQLAQHLPEYATSVQDWAIAWLSFFQIELGSRGIAIDLASLYKNSDLPTQVGLVGSGLVVNTITVVGGVASVVTNLTIILVLSFYLVLDGDVLLRKVSQYIPARYQIEGSYFFASINRTFGGFLRGTLVVSLVYSLGNALVMTIAGLNFVVLASLVAAVLVIIPLFGPVIAMILPILLAALSGDITKLIVVVIGLLALQLVVYNVISPRVMGQSVGLHPLLVFLALLVGLKQAGLVGAIFGVPFVGVVWAMIVYFFQKRVAAAAVAAGPSAGDSPEEGQVKAASPALLRSFGSVAGRLRYAVATRGRHLTREVGKNGR